MRVAVIFVAMLVVTTPSRASQSCMSKAEARQHFHSVHIYWHGPDRCWDATPAQRRQIHGVQRRTPIPEIQRKNDRPKLDQAKLDQPRIDGRSDQRKWRDQMSEALADGGRLQTIGVSRGARHDGNDDAATGKPWIDLWIDRWVDVEPSPLAERPVDVTGTTPPPIIEREADPSMLLRRLVLVCLVLVLALATIEILFVGSIYQRAKPRHS
jgi:hypothetical protein